MPISTQTIEAQQVLSNKEIEFLHNELVSSWLQAGYTQEDIAKQYRAALILGFARSVEYAVLSRAAPGLLGGLN